MKIEKINENQIRCTLNAGDLISRKLKISELAYGSEKAKRLFKDVMAKAGSECGFEADDMPIVIEAVPVNPDCLVLNVTKVEDPEELDTRFAKFAPSVLGDESGFEGYSEDLLEDFFSKIKEAEEEMPALSIKSEKGTPGRVYIYTFDSLSTVIRLSHVLSVGEKCINTLYKDNSDGTLHLALHTDDIPAPDITRIINTLAEYGTADSGGVEKSAFLSEHCDVLIRDHALQSLRIV